MSERTRESRQMANRRLAEIRERAQEAASYTGAEETAQSDVLFLLALVERQSGTIDVLRSEYSRLRDQLATDAEAAAGAGENT